MKTLLSLLVMTSVLLVGCAKDDPTDAAAPKGNMPTIKTAPPGAMSPEERSKAQGGGAAQRTEGADVGSG